MEDMRKELQNSTKLFLDSHPEERSVNENWNQLKSTLLNIMNKYIPNRTTKYRHKVPWITQPLKRQMRKRDHTFTKAKKSNKSHDWSAFRQQRNKVAKLLNKSHNHYLNEIIGNSLQDNPKKFYGYVKSQRTENIGVPALVAEGKLKISDKDKAETLNKKFQSVFTDERPNVPNKGQSPYAQIKDLQIGLNGVQKQLCSIKANKATGPDELPARVLRDTAEEIAPVIQYIFQQSLDHGKLPTDWTKALVTAIYKKGDKTNPGNYRPISLTCIICKVMEHVVLSHLAKHLRDNGILTDEQHGFRQCLSCETQLITAAHDWATSLNNKGQVDAVLLDISKAFDKVAHNRLLAKLRYYGVEENTLGWIKAFLSNRTQAVSINGTHSSYVPVTSGVPQGSVLGPALFLLYINDITEGVTSQMRLFADDSIIYREITTPNDHKILQEDINRLTNWAHTWQMDFNVDKCYLLSITKKPKPSHFNYTMNGKLLQRTSSHPYLGVEISDNLSWSKHCDIISRAASKTLGLVMRTLGPCSQTVKSHAYETLVRPKLEYGAAAWNPYTEQDVAKLERVQRRAARFVCSDWRQQSSVTKMQETLKWDHLEKRRLLSQATMFHRIHHGNVNITFPEAVKPAPNRSRRKQIMQHQYGYQQLQCNNQIFQYSFYVRIIPIWNLLPATAVTLTDSKLFQAAAMPTIRCLQPPPYLKRY